jgi:hypothetical protein
MADAFDRPDGPPLGNETPFKSEAVARERELPLERAPSSALPPVPVAAPAPAESLIRAAEFIGGTAGKIVGTSKSVYRKLDARHKEDMRAIRRTAGEIEQEAVTLSDTAVEISGSVKRYLRSHDAGDMAADVVAIAKRYPKQSLAIAAVMGFLVERALLKRNA